MMATITKFLTITTAVVMAWCGGASAQLPVEYEARYDDPLYGGIGSQGALPQPQPSNPVFFFEERVNWPALNIEQPRTAWEYAQRGIYRQDSLEDREGAKADYEQSALMDDRILIVQARLGVIALLDNRPDEAIEHFEHVAEEAPFHEGVHLKLAEAYEQQNNLVKAEEAFKRELALAPNSQVTHFVLAELFFPLAMDGTCASVFIDPPRDCRQEAINSIDAYLRQARWHSDTQPLRILKAQRYCQQLLSPAIPSPEPGCQ
jgi:tetratricopeptide (TPR) repeat protein